MKQLPILVMIPLTLAYLSSPAQTRELVVVESNVARYSAGELFPAETVFRLDQGQRIVIATNSGMVALEGPHAATAEGDPPGEASALRALRRFIGTRSSEFSGLGGTRGAGEEAERAIADTRPSPWYINAEITGEQCYVEGRPVEIWRSDINYTSRFEIREVSTDRIGTVSWSASEHTTSWPAELQPRNGEIYLVREADELVSGTSIQVFSLAPDAADDPFAAAAWLAARGCTSQARIALAELD